jgi:deoxycytidylate deaminase
VDGAQGDEGSVYAQGPPVSGERLSTPHRLHLLSAQAAQGKSVHDGEGSLMNEFERLAEIVGNSGCAKKQIAAGTYVWGQFVWSVNTCLYEGFECPRLHMPTGVGYDLCKAVHAESQLAALVSQVMQKESDGIAWVFGHYYGCEPCAAELKRIGVKEIRVRECL